MQATETYQPQQSQSQWIDGIELLRAIAVALVTISHGFNLLNNWSNPISDFLSSCISSFFKPGWWGVRIFFAISGYLIASQSIKVLHKGSANSAKNFALRRWIRTVPTYWIFLVADIVRQSKSCDGLRDHLCQVLDNLMTSELRPKKVHGVDS